jgi:hypothetical protein
VCGDTVKWLQFADDITLYTTAESVIGTRIALNQCMKRFGVWCNALGFAVAETKIKVVMFTTKKKYILPDRLPVGKFKLS